MKKSEFIKDVTLLLKELKKEIADDYRASEEDTLPSMQVTISTDNSFENWNYQTGDNSYTGGCYGHPHWSVLSLYRRSNCRELAKEAYEELQDLIATAEYCESFNASTNE